MVQLMIFIELMDNRALRTFSSHARSRAFMSHTVSKLWDLLWGLRHMVFEDPRVLRVSVLPFVPSMLGRMRLINMEHIRDAFLGLFDCAVVLIEYVFFI